MPCFPHSAILGRSGVRLGPQLITFIPENPSASPWCANPIAEGKRTETRTRLGHSGASNVGQETFSIPNRNRSNGCICGMGFLVRSPKTKGQRVGNHSRAGSGIDRPQARSPTAGTQRRDRARPQRPHSGSIRRPRHPPPTGPRVTLSSTRTRSARAPHPGD